MKTYAEKLRDPRWQRKRLEIMERDGFSCASCGDAQSTLNVHHCYYGKGKDPWQYEDRFLMTLCEACHKDIENKREEILKSLNWSPRIDAIHALATCDDDWTPINVSMAFQGGREDGELLARIRRIRYGIADLELYAQSLQEAYESQRSINP